MLLRAQKYTGALCQRKATHAMGLMLKELMRVAVYGVYDEAACRNRLIIIAATLFLPVGWELPQ